MVEINRCTRQNFCVDCDDPDCLLAGEYRSGLPEVEVRQSDNGLRAVRVFEGI